MNGSISFDRAADFYDATRGLEPRIADAITDALLAELRRAGADRLLEVGIGTGRMSRPLMREGVSVTGVDISAAMMERLRKQLEAEHTVPDLILGDATRLPFRRGSFPAVLIVHVLHLITDWPRAIDEIRRVLTPGGIALRQQRDNDFEECAEHRESGAKWDAVLAKRGFTPRERAAADSTNEYVRSLGGEVQTLRPAEGFHMRSEATWVRELRERIHSNLWEVPDDIYWPAVDEYEAWAIERFGDLSEERRIKDFYELDVWRFD